MQVHQPKQQNSSSREKVGDSQMVENEGTRKVVSQDSKKGNADQTHALVNKLPGRKSRSQQRKKMMKRTNSGQPLMKYRIEKLLSQI